MNINDILRHWPDVAKDTQTRKVEVTINNKTVHKCDRMNCAKCNQLEKDMNNVMSAMDKLGENFK